MKIYFTTSYEGSVNHNKEIKYIINKLESLGHKVSKRVLRIYSKIDEENKDIFDYKSISLDEVYKMNMKRIREADLVITDLTVPSSGGGYEIAIAESEKKQILGLFNSSSSRVLSENLLGNSSKLFQLKNYDSEKSIDKILEEFITSAKNVMDTKFILIISPEIDNYLEWASVEKRQHKAQIVRNAIEAVIQKDKDYTAFKKEN